MEKIEINPEIYSLDVIYSAAYVLLDKAYIKLEGDPKNKMIVKIRKKEDTKEDLDKIKGRFEEELLNYSFYKKQLEKTKDIRDIIMNRALLTNQSEDNLKGDEEFSGDPEDIVPWEDE
ncbi:MAG: His-Xaa-Ser system protein HxsD [Candidatus Woesearchaeota archaeon]